MTWKNYFKTNKPNTPKKNEPNANTGLQPKKKTNYKLKIEAQYFIQRTPKKKVKKNQDHKNISLQINNWFDINENEIPIITLKFTHHIYCNGKIIAYHCKFLQPTQRQLENISGQKKKHSKSRIMHHIVYAYRFFHSSIHMHTHFSFFFQFSNILDLIYIFWSINEPKVNMQNLTVSYSCVNANDI